MQWNLTVEVMGVEFASMEFDSKDDSKEKYAGKP